MDLHALKYAIRSANVAPLAALAPSASQTLHEAIGYVLQFAHVAGPRMRH
nr:hypothetical protein [uncultured Pseudogulbenkiania sp.]